MSSPRLILGYVALVGLPLLALLGVLGAWGPPPHPDLTAAAPATALLPASSGAFLLLLQIAVILLASRLGGALFRYAGQPQVMGETVAGIMLGPSLLGWLAPGASAALFPAASLSHLAVLSQLGLVLFMFLVGLSLSPHGLHDWKHASVLTSHASIILPFLFGAVLATKLYPGFAGPRASLTVFGLFMGAAMSITAFPVLARILTERNLIHSRTGALAIACAAVDDVTGWCILAYITVLVRAPESAIPIWLTLAGCLLLIGVMLYVVRPLARHLETMFTEEGGLRESALVLIVLLMLASALATEFLGIHVLFGSFLAGAIMPRSAALVDYLRGKLEGLTLLLLLPLFFAFTGLRTRIGLVHGAGMWWTVVAIVLVAVAGKMGGSTLAARWAGLSWRDAGAVGALLNTRGLMELVILNIGLELQVITPQLFTMMVIMAIVTTLMTAPLLDWIRPPTQRESARLPATVRLRTLPPKRGSTTSR